jgi:uncharacterized membrane protein YphA (DoxX/SURF4 family)
MELLIYSTMILFMYFVAGINKLLHFKNTVSGFKNMFILKKLPNLFYQFIIICVILLEIIAPIIIIYSIQTKHLENLACISSISLGIFTILATLIYHFPPKGSNYYAFMKNLTATGSLFLLSTVFH